MERTEPTKPPYWKIVTEVFVNDSHKHGRHFRIPTDPIGMDFDRRSRRQWNAFFYNPQKNRNRKGFEIWYIASHEWEWINSHEIFKKSMTKFGEIIPDPEFIELKSLNDLFPLIGYDYKAKKWL